MHKKYQKKNVFVPPTPFVQNFLAVIVVVSVLL